MKKANVGIAMGGVGSDIVVDAADIALVDDEIVVDRHCEYLIYGAVLFEMSAFIQ